MLNPVAIVIPVWKENLTEFEKVSFEQCCSILKKYPFCLVSYKGLNIQKYTEILKRNLVDFKVTFFDKKLFASITDYNRLMLSVSFYSRFVKFKYILLCQLDCFVFRDELDSWINADYSYIGAPWLKGYGLAQYGDPVIGVGNGGFSLRKVSDHLKILLSFSYIKKPNMFLRNFAFFPPCRLVSCLYSFLKNVTFYNNTFFLFNNWTLNEDGFWADVAALNFLWFKIPEYKVAAQFSTEVQPRYFFDLNHGKLPFGCHAWWTYDLEFWKPHIEKFGYRLTSLNDLEKRA